jgi:hypothetical protein
LPMNLYGDELRAFAELARAHPVFMVDDLALIDLRKDGGDIRVFTVAAPGSTHTSVLEGWLVGPYPRPRLVADARRRASIDQLVQTALVARSPATAPPTPALRGPPLHGDPRRTEAPTEAPLGGKAIAGPRGAGPPTPTPTPRKGVKRSRPDSKKRQHPQRSGGGE